MFSFILAGGLWTNHLDFAKAGLFLFFLYSLCHLYWGFLGPQSPASVSQHHASVSISAELAELCTAARWVSWPLALNVCSSGRSRPLASHTVHFSLIPHRSLSSGILRAPVGGRGAAAPVGPGARHQSRENLLEPSGLADLPAGPGSCWNLSPPPLPSSPFRP